MFKLIVTGCSTNVGKTLTSAILVTALQGDYWKPVESGTADESDTLTVQKLSSTEGVIHAPSYRMHSPLSPHHVARLENITIRTENITPPQTNRPLIIETAGGILVPLNDKTLTLDLFSTWNALWVVVSRNYLGSINHTLLTIETLKQREVKIGGIIFNGEPNPDSESAIVDFAQLPCLGRILPEQVLNKNTIQTYANQWKKKLELL